MNIRGQILGALLLLTSVCFAAEDKITLRWNVKPEERYENQVKMAIDAGENGTLFATIHFAERILSVTEKSITASVFIPGLSVQTSGALEAAAANFEDMRRMSYERECDPLGKSLSIAGNSALSTSVDLVLPANPVGIGDRWESTFAPNAEIGNVKITYVLEKFDANVAIIRADLQESDKLSVIKPYRFIIDRASGRYKSAEGGLKMTIMGLTLSVTFSQRTIVPVKLRSNGA